MPVNRSRCPRVLLKAARRFPEEAEEAGVELDLDWLRLEDDETVLGIVEGWLDVRGTPEWGGVK